MLHRTLAFPLLALTRWLAWLVRVAPADSALGKRLRQNRAELEQMSARELNDLGISRGDISGLLDDPLDWRRDRR